MISDKVKNNPSVRKQAPRPDKRVRYQTEDAMKSHALELIQPVSKKDQVVTMLKEAILSGRIASGDQIVESRISGQLGVGPIEAIAMSQSQILGTSRVKLSQ